MHVDHEYGAAQEHLPDIDEVKKVPRHGDELQMRISLRRPSELWMGVQKIFDGVTDISLLRSRWEARMSSLDPTYGGKDARQTLP